MRKSQGDAFSKVHGIKLGFMSPFVKASAYALMDLPVVNAVIDGQDIVYRDYVDISVAVATPKVNLSGDTRARRNWLLEL
jgi:2-oxoglutarate dehydrogenase E2 component (dihydrolipoamide succinyltransferase)